MDWNEKAKRLLKSELIKRGVTNSDLVLLLKEIDIEEDKESNGLVATLLTLGTVGTSVVLIKKRH